MEPKRASFMLSLDCEGKWGIVDNLEKYKDRINSNNLDAAYKKLYEALNDTQLKATFAFTDMFTLDKEKVLERVEGLRAISYKSRWYELICDAIENEGIDGWVGSEYYKNATLNGHELGWHGYTHHSLEDHVDEEIINFEFSNAKEIWNENNASLESMIFPRNAEGNFRKVKEFGFKGFRRSLSATESLHNNKYYRLASEFNILQKSQKEVECLHDLHGVCAGNFLNWRVGARKFVNNKITILRWQHIISDAIRTKRCAHMWFHPHNLITDPSMAELFAEILFYVKKKISDGDLINIKMSHAKNL